MYSHCLFCSASLGTNGVVEHFPVGRRLAFDAAKGRLWVVCRRCQRWNLTPLEERWEAIEECERRFRETRTRLSTDNIGLARLAEGLELVRIGQPQRPEFAAWRYGDQFGRRRTRMLMTVGAVVAVGGVAVATGAFALLKAVVPGGPLLYQLPNLYNLYRQTRMVHARVPDENGRTLIIRGKHLGRVELFANAAGERWGLRLTHDEGHTVLTGEPALRLAGRLLASFNSAGAFQHDVRGAVARLADAGSPDELIARAAARGHAQPPRFRAKWQESQSALRRLPLVERLALEMAANEEQERRALGRGAGRAPGGVERGRRDRGHRRPHVPAAERGGVAGEEA